MSSGEPCVSVLLSAHDGLRLRWLLNALAGQACAGAEIVVAHRPSNRETAEPLSQHGDLPGLRTVPAARDELNAARRAARARTVLVLREDLRPPPGLLSLSLELAERHPAALLYGTVAPDPVESNLMRSPLSFTWDSPADARWPPPAPLLCPAELLEAAGGFDGSLPASELAGAALAVRVRRAGGSVRLAPELCCYAGVEPFAPRRLLARMLAPRHFPEVRRRYPELGAWAPAHRGRGVRSGIARAVGNAALVWGAGHPR